MDETTNDSVSHEENRPKVALSARHMNPEALMNLGPRVNETPYAVCAIIAFVVFLVTLMLLFMDYSTIKVI